MLSLCVHLGTARGCGWQKIGAYVNLGSYYLIGIPCAVVFAFVLHIGGKVKVFTLFLHNFKPFVTSSLKLQVILICEKFCSQGLWLGIICALVVQVLSLLTVTLRTNWEQQVQSPLPLLFFI